MIVTVILSVILGSSNDTAVMVTFSYVTSVALLLVGAVTYPVLGLIEPPGRPVIVQTKLLVANSPDDKYACPYQLVNVIWGRVVTTSGPITSMLAALGSTIIWLGFSNPNIPTESDPIF
jgi:hypothetical protein